MELTRTTGGTVARDLGWFFRRAGSRFPVSYVSVPIEMPEGRGAVVAFADIEDRLRAERVLRERDAVLRAREDSLPRIAALVSGGAASADVFAAVAREVGRVVGLTLVGAGVALRPSADESDRDQSLERGSASVSDRHPLTARRTDDLGPSSVHRSRCEDPVACEDRRVSVRRLAVPDLTTTVLTMTLTGLVADLPLAAGVSRATTRRLAAVFAMFAKALMLRVDIALPLAVAAGLALVTGVVT